MLIGFTHKTSKILPRVFCRRFRHCAVVTNITNLPDTSVLPHPCSCGRGRSRMRPGDGFIKIKDVNLYSSNPPPACDTGTPTSASRGGGWVYKNQRCKLNLFNLIKLTHPPVASQPTPAARAGVGQDEYTLIQFVHRGKIEFIPLSPRDIKILENHGWVFIKAKVKSRKEKGKSKKAKVKSGKAKGVVVKDIFVQFVRLSPLLPFAFLLLPFAFLLLPFTCVSLAKRILGIRNPFIITPDQLYKKLVNAPTRTTTSKLCHKSRT